MLGSWVRAPNGSKVRIPTESRVQIPDYLLLFNFHFDDDLFDCLGSFDAQAGHVGVLREEDGEGAITQ